MTIIQLVLLCLDHETCGFTQLMSDRPGPIVSASGYLGRPESRFDLVKEGSREHVVSLQSWGWNVWLDRRSSDIRVFRGTTWGGQT